MSHRVVLLYGPGTGLGKSTVAAEVIRRLAQEGVPARLIREEDVMDIAAFHKYVQQVQQGNAQDIETLLQSCQGFVHDLTRVPEVAVVDSLFPCWDWISTAGCPESIVASFTERLCVLLRPLNPLLIYLVGDLDIGLARAVKDRGEEWGLSLAVERTGVRDLGALREYLGKIRAVADRMLIHWPYDLVRVDSTRCEVKAAVDQVMAVFQA